MVLHKRSGEGFNVVVQCTYEKWGEVLTWFYVSEVRRGFNVVLHK